MTKGFLFFLGIKYNSKGPRPTLSGLDKDDPSMNVVCRTLDNAFASLDKVLVKYKIRPDCHGNYNIS